MSQKGGSVKREGQNSVFFFSSRGLGADPLGPLEILRRKGDTTDQIRHVPLLRKKNCCDLLSFIARQPLEYRKKYNFIYINKKYYYYYYYYYFPLY